MCYSAESGRSKCVIIRLVVLESGLELSSPDLSPFLLDLDFDLDLKALDLDLDSDLEVLPASPFSSPLFCTYT